MKIVDKKYIQLTKKERKGKTAKEIMELREARYLNQFVPSYRKQEV